MVGNMTRKLFLAAVAAASLLLAACGSTESGTFTLRLEHQDCLGNDVLENALNLEVTVSGPGMEDVVGAGKKEDGGLDLGEIPAGKDRVATVRAINGAGALWAIGRSEKFEVVADQDREVVVPMVGLNQTHPTATGANECTTLSTARAGHSAAAFANGRVLVVGGFVVNQEAEGPKFTYLDTVEMYDPATGGFQSLGALPSICGPNGDESCARAFAPALVQATNKGERLLVIGGEYRDEAGTPLSRGEILAFEPATGEWTAIKLQQPRRHHTATLLDGTVFIVGGLGNPANEGELPPVVGPTELLEKNSINTQVGKVSVPRAFHGAVALNKELFIAGGLDATLGLPPKVLRISYGNRDQQTEGVPLGDLGNDGVIGPSLTIHARRLVVIGGIVPVAKDAFLGSLDLLARVPNFAAGPEGRGWKGVVLPLDSGAAGKQALDNTYPLTIDRSFACTAKIDENRFLVAGGLNPVGQVVINNSSVEVLTWVDKSVCLPGPFDAKNEPITCDSDTQCSSPTKCVSGKCRLACTSDAGCGTKGVCVDGYCAGNVENPDHRCSSAATACFAGSKCVEDGEFDSALIGGSTAASSKLIDARAWGACTTLSADQILITGGISGSPDRAVLGAAEIYEITHAGR